MKRNQRGFGNIFVVVAIIVILAVAGFYLLKGKVTTPSSYPNQQTTTSIDQSIQNDSGLTNASNDLDNTNVDGTLDPELNQNSADAQTF